MHVRGVHGELIYSYSQKSFLGEVKMGFRSRGVKWKIISRGRGGWSLFELSSSPCLAGRVGGRIPHRPHSETLAIHYGQNILICLKIYFPILLYRAKFPEIKKFLAKFPEIKKYPENWHLCTQHDNCQSVLILLKHDIIYIKIRHLFHFVRKLTIFIVFFWPSQIWTIAASFTVSSLRYIREDRKTLFSLYNWKHTHGKITLRYVQKLTLNEFIV